MFYNLALFIITLVGGSIPLWKHRAINDDSMHLLLAFSGSFLLGITFLHLLPEAFENLHFRAGVYLLIGFFLQLLIQRATHGIEHGHTHVHPHGSLPLAGIVTGLTVHAFMEGLPLGFNYREAGTGPSLYFAVAAHKLPEAMLLVMLAIGARGKKYAAIVLLLFACVTPLAAIIATKLGMHYALISRMVTAVIPIVAGAFIHIATTIFFESGTRQHMLTGKKVAAIVAGLGCAAATLFLD